MAKLKYSLIIILLAFQMISAQGFPKACIDEILALPAKNPNFDVKTFLTDLPVEVVKTKVKLKLPFGKPKDSEVTSVGITVGCAKVFPENPTQIAITIKDIGIELAKKMGKKAIGDVASNLITTGVGTLAGKANDTSPVPGTANTNMPNLSPVINEPVLKKCDFIFNPEKKFCYDGAVYDKCDGMEYNPTTHLCIGDIANRALCNNIPYNPTTQRCEDNVIQLKCGDDWYNPVTHSCYDKSNVVVAKCGINPQAYNPDLMECKPDINANGIFLKTPVQHEDENYEAVLIGEQIWLAKNLNNNIDGSVCYDNNADNCAAYGKLFDLETARTACPTGWYLPSDTEWKMLVNYVGGMVNAGGKLKATNFGGTDTYGFAALPNGFGHSNRYSGVGDLSYWWSSTESNANGAYGWLAKRLNGFLSEETFGKSNLFGIRCLQYVDAKKRKTTFPINVVSEPAGAALKFNGSSTSGCPATPCKIELQEGKYNISFTKDFYDSVNTAINLTGDRYVNIKLSPNFGILTVKEPDYLNDIGRYEQWNFTLNGKPFLFGDIRIFPGSKYSIKLTHRCYENIVDSVSVKKGDNVNIDVTKKIVLKQSQVSLNATYKWKNVEEPIFVNQQEIGKTPFKGSVPFCSEIAIMEPENNIKIRLSETNLAEYTYEKSIFLSTLGGTVLNFAGAIFLGIGLSANADAEDYYKNYSKLSLDVKEKQSKFNDSWDKYEEKKKDRNFYYIIGSVLLFSGIGVHIWF
ncbi:MAG: PEGA domain-containing protein [Fibromonadaceae bacterium]|jgi:uncharacterized protein (TIGR02145 family)|nr:PEGA domain-containing protein [Fibromonadaceae bacterium]